MSDDMSDAQFEDDGARIRELERERDGARAEAAALRAALRRLADYEGGASDIDHARTTLASDAGRRALDAVRLAAWALTLAEPHYHGGDSKVGAEIRAALAALRAAFPGVDPK